MTAAQMQQQLIAQLDTVLKEFQNLKGRSRDDHLSGLPKEETMRFVTRARAAIHRIAGRPSVYVDQCEEIMHTQLFTRQKAQRLAGVINSLRADVIVNSLRTSWR